MELKATTLGKRMARHPYDRVQLLNAGVRVSGDSHEYIIPFNQLLSIHCKRGLIWGELEFVLSESKVVRLHGTQWSETQHFFHYLNARWQQWSREMSTIAADLLRQQWAIIVHFASQETWLTRQQITDLQNNLRRALTALPLPTRRLSAFDNCRELWQQCQHWTGDIEKIRQTHNQAVTGLMVERYRDFFTAIKSSSLDMAQMQAVINRESTILIDGSVGSGKTSVLMARAGWLLARGEATAEQILLLAFNGQAQQQMTKHIGEQLPSAGMTVRTFPALALHIVQQGSKKVPTLSKLESDSAMRQALLLTSWCQQCQEKKTQARGWRQWLQDTMGWQLPEGEFWQDKKIQQRLAYRLDQWLRLLRMHGGSQSAMIESAPESMRALFSKHVKLMAPLLKAWKSALRAENAVDFSGLIHQAINILDKGRFINPWKHILVDEFQDISPQRAALLAALRRQNSQTHLFVVGDDRQAICRFSDQPLLLTATFEHYFGTGDRCVLERSYRINSRIAEVANGFIQQNSHQQSEPLSCALRGNKNAVTLLADDKLAALLDKLSGYARAEQRILLLARYPHLKPDILEKATTRWPHLQLEFMTIHASKGQQADYVIVLGLEEGDDAFPAPARETILEQVLLPLAEEFPDAEERRLLYVAITRARLRVWLLFNKTHPSSFVGMLQDLAVPVAQKPSC